MKIPSHLPAEAIIELSGIPRRTFFNRVIKEKIWYIEQFRGGRLYQVNDWNKKCPDYLIKAIR